MELLLLHHSRLSTTPRTSQSRSNLIIEGSDQIMIRTKLLMSNKLTFKPFRQRGVRFKKGINTRTARSTTCAQRFLSSALTMIRRILVKVETQSREVKRQKRLRTSKCAKWVKIPKIQTMNWSNSKTTSDRYQRNRTCFKFRTLNS